jgi:hypothetical protein
MYIYIRIHAHGFQFQKAWVVPTRVLIQLLVFPIEIAARFHHSYAQRKEKTGMLLLYSAYARLAE